MSIGTVRHQHELGGHVLVDVGISWLMLGVSIQGRGWFAWLNVIASKSSTVMAAAVNFLPRWNPRYSSCPFQW